MQDTTLFETIRGLQTPWHIARVTLDTTGERVDLWAEHDADTRWPCPEGRQELPCRDHAEERVWRQLDTCQYQTFFHARVPRVECPTHGVRPVRVPWAEARRRFTLLRERLVIDRIRQGSTRSGACRIARIRWDEGWGVMARAVARGRARNVAQPIPYLGVDEKAFRKGHRYHTIVCDLERSTGDCVAEDRCTDSLAASYRTRTDAQRAGLTAVAMDLWEPYIIATREGLPAGDQQIVVDRFHILRDMTAAVDIVRKQEHRACLRAGLDSPLTGTTDVWLLSAERLPEYHAETFATLQAVNLTVGRAWAITEALRTLWT